MEGSVLGSCVRASISPESKRSPIEFEKTPKAKPVKLNSRERQCFKSMFFILFILN
jgi:hypothetical protein